jgi:hypothetical protein
MLASTPFRTECPFHRERETYSTPHTVTKATNVAHSSGMEKKFSLSPKPKYENTKNYHGCFPGLRSEDDEDDT